MNELQIFSYSDKQVRTLLRNGEPWFVLKDVCDVLDLSNSRMVAERLDHDEVSQAYVTDSLGRLQETTIINEPGLYNMILRSDKHEAKAFKRWITHEVLPAIRKTGGYVGNDELFINTYLPFADDNTKLLFKNTLAVINQQNEKIRQLAPKAEAYDTFMDGSNLQTMNDVAKCLGIGRNKLFKFLRDKGIMRANNTPYQDYIDRGYFEVKEKPITMGETTINYAQTYVTAKGVDYLRKVLNQVLVTV